MFAIPQNIKIISVTKLNRFAKQVLESEIGQVWVSGEISNFTRAASGHWYFTLKDDKAQVRTCMFKGANQKVNFQPKHGDKIIVRANLSIYEARGDYQLIAVSMEPEGIGKLKQAFEALKIQLQEQGLFSQQNKQLLPEKISTIGLVTSPTGAAVHDVLHVLKRRNPAIKVVIYPSMVQGNEAALSIAKQIQIANIRNEVDGHTVGRGGGSLEDLWPFNEEVVARAIYASSIPTVSAVGHEVDVTIADFVADMRAATPSAAAELLSEDAQELSKQLNHKKVALMRAFNNKLYLKNDSAKQLSKRLVSQHPLKKLQQNQQAFDYLNARLLQQHPLKLIRECRQNHRSLAERLQVRHPNALLTKNQLKLQQVNDRIKQSIEQKMANLKLASTNIIRNLQLVSPKNDIKQRCETQSQLQHDLIQYMNVYLQTKMQSLSNTSALLNTVSPLSTLSRGYSITMKENVLVDKIERVDEGDIMITKLKDGEIRSQVIEKAISKPS